MSFSNLLKQLKKKLRTQKRRLSLGMVAALLGAAAAASAGLLQRQDVPAGGALPVMAPSAGPESAAEQAALRAIAASGSVREAYAEKLYVCGEETEKLGSMGADAILRRHKENPEEEVLLEEDGTVHFRRHIDDLSRRCKENAYFGLDKSDNLSLFEGLPDHDRVIRTFFQMNVSHLKSSLPPETWKQLYSGIRVTDLAEYNSVISTFSDYAEDRIR